RQNRMPAQYAGRCNRGTLVPGRGGRTVTVGFPQGLLDGPLFVVNRDCGEELHTRLPVIQSGRFPRFPHSKGARKLKSKIGTTSPTRTAILAVVGLPGSQRDRP